MGMKLLTHAVIKGVRKVLSKFLIGEIKIDNEGNYFYLTVRNSLKNHIYTKKSWFTSSDGIDVKKIVNAIGISNIICKELLRADVKYIKFQILNYPGKGQHYLAKIDLIKFLSNSFKIMEWGYDKQRIISIDELELIRRF